MKVEPEKQKVISRKHWMFRLYKWTWNRDAEYRGYCGLFWMSILNLGIIPLTIVGKSFGFFVDLIVKIWPKSEEKEDVFFPEDYEIVKAYETMINSNITETHDDFVWRVHWKIRDWIVENPAWRSYYPSAKERLLKQEALDEIRLKKYRILEEKQQARKAIIDAKLEKLTNVLKYFVKPALVGSALLTVYGIYKVIGWFISIFSWTVAWSVLMNLVCIVAIVVGFYLGYKSVAYGFKLFEGIVKLVDKPEEVVIEEPGIFSKISIVIREVIEFVINAIDIVYHKKCPLIVLTDDETRPIEKIKKS
jgi:hypothetical protein